MAIGGFDGTTTTALVEVLDWLEWRWVEVGGLPSRLSAMSSAVISSDQMGAEAVSRLRFCKKNEEERRLMMAAMEEGSEENIVNNLEVVEEVLVVDDDFFEDISDDDSNDGEEELNAFFYLESDGESINADQEVYTADEESEDYEDDDEILINH